MRSYIYTYTLYIDGYRSKMKDTHCQVEWHINNMHFLHCVMAIKTKELQMKEKKKKMMENALRDIVIN